MKISHNDYLNKQPLTTALDRGYIGVESDIIVTGIFWKRLDCSHHFAPRFLTHGSLEELYLKPLLLMSETGRLNQFTKENPFYFCIEFKTGSKKAIDLLGSLIERYKLPENICLVILKPAGSYSREIAANQFLSKYAYLKPQNYTKLADGINFDDINDFGFWQKILYKIFPGLH